MADIVEWLRDPIWWDGSGSSSLGFKELVHEAADFSKTPG